MRKELSLIATVFVMALLTGCMSFNNAEVPVVENKIPKTKPLIEMKIGNFVKTHNGLGGASNTFLGNNAATNILVHWKRKGLISDYDVIGNLDEKPDYTLIVNGSVNEESSFLSCFITGFTFYLIPSSITLDYDLDLKLQDNSNGNVYICEVQNSNTMWQQIIFFPAFPIFWIGAFNMWTDMSMYSYNEFYKKGAFNKFYGESLKDVSTDSVKRENDKSKKITASQFLLLLKQAEQNDPKAQFTVGRCYFEGQGVLKDPKEAKEWIKKAYGNGNKEAKKYWENNEMWKY